MTVEGKWVTREEKTASGRIVRWRERKRADGSYDREFEDEGYERVAVGTKPLNTRAAYSGAQPVAVRLEATADGKFTRATVVEAA